MVRTSFPENNNSNNSGPAPTRKQKPRSTPKETSEQVSQASSYYDLGIDSTPLASSLARREKSFSLHSVCRTKLKIVNDLQTTASYRCTTSRVNDDPLYN